DLFLEGRLESWRWTMIGEGRSRRRILVVDDEPLIVEMLARLLVADGHQVATASDGLAALNSVAEARPDLVVLDIDMPVMSGLEVCRRLKQDPETRLIPVLMLTGRAPTDARLQAWDLGADEFLSKPFRGAEVAARCRSLLRQKELIDDLDNAQSVVFALARAVEAKNPYTHGHSERVGMYAEAMGRHIGLSAADLDLLRRGAAVHDIGKISTPDAVLDKPGRLTPEEFEIIKRHPAEGARIIEPLHSLRECVPLVRWHHERLDGSGYPDGLTRDEIPQLVRILAVADVYDALASERPYRPAMSHQRCLQVLAEDVAKGALDLDLVYVFSEVVKEPITSVLRPH
ncbi:MAG TPA: HD domain-containing phosphohydrolase, partial [Pirellulales bacterium]